MVIPAVGIVVQDHDSRAVPIIGLFEGVDHIDDECLLIHRVGITSMAILKADCLKETDCRKFPCFHRCIKVIDVVVVIRRTVVSDFVHGRRPGVVRICSSAQYWKNAWCGM